MNYYKIFHHSIFVLRLSRFKNRLICDNKVRKPFFQIISTYSNDNAVRIFQGNIDNFNGVTVDVSDETSNPNEFKHNLDSSLSKWLEEGRKCIWFKVNIQRSFCVPILAEGFNFHHARGNFVMMYRWLRDDMEPNLPPPSHTNMGVGAMVFNDRGQILAVSERHYDYPHWKLPGGYIERGEDIIAAAEREVKEETGVESKFESLVTFRHTHHMMFNNSDVYIILRMSALTNEITKSNREIQQCKWMEVEEYMNHPHVHQWNRFIVLEALEHKKKGFKLDIQKKTVKWAKNVREMNVLLVEDL